MKYRIRHLTRIRYGGLVRLARFNLRLMPYGWPDQQIDQQHLHVDPAPAECSSQPGAYPVIVTRMRIDEPLSTLSIESSFEATIDDKQRRLASGGGPTIAEVAASALRVNNLGPLAPANYLFASMRAPMVPAIRDWALPDLASGREVTEAVLSLARRIQRELAYVPGVTDAGTPAAGAFQARRGVCQDFAHIMVIALRTVGLPAAYASGYLRTDPPPGQARLIGADAAHAWVMLWCGPDLGWVGFDPTNGVMAGTDHVLIGTGRDYADVMPVDGLFVGPAAQWMDVEVDVLPV